jgi:hypothetical protein
MKKLLALLLAVCLLLSLSACGDTPIEKCQKKVVSVGEAYLDFEITIDEAVSQLESIKVPETEGDGQDQLESDLWLLTHCIKRQESTYADVEFWVEYIRDRTYK